MTPLRCQMIEDLAVRGMAANTRKSYLHAVSQLAQYYNRRPDQLSAREVQRFLVHLHEERGLAWSSCNLYTQALRFFYRITLGRAAVEFYIPCARQEQRLPEILSRKEVRRLFESASNVRNRALLIATYGAGLRASEVICLKITDIDSDRMTLRIDQGKGKKDQGVADIGIMPDRPVDELSILLQRFDLAALGTLEHAADNVVVHVHGGIGEGRYQFENRRDQNGSPATGRHAA